MAGLMDMLGPAAGLLGSIFGDVTAADSVAATNAQNYKIFEENKAWQTDMSNTAEQRRFADYKAAGVNPLLVTSSQGASQPSVTPPTMQAPGASFANVGQQVTSAMGLRTQQAQIDNINAQTRNTDAQTDQKLPAEVENLKAQFGLTTAQATNAKAQTDGLIWQSSQAHIDWELADVKQALAMNELAVNTAIRDQLVRRAAAQTGIAENELSMSNSAAALSKTPLGPVIAILNALLSPLAHLR